MIKLSFIVAAFNVDKYVKECIKSCLNQKDTSISYDVIVVDDFSNDKTREILNSIKSNHVKLIKNSKNMGIEKSVNKAIKASKSDFICRVDADDTIENNFLNVWEKYLKVNSDFFYYSNYNLIYEGSNIIKSINLPKFSEDEIFERGDFLATGTIFKKEFFVKYGDYITDLKNCGLENYEFILRLLKNKINGFHINENLFNVLRHQDNLSSKKISSIINYGKKMMPNFSNKQYQTNKFHPYQLKISNTNAYIVTSDQKKLIIKEIDIKNS